LVFGGFSEAISLRYGVIGRLPVNAKTQTNPAEVNFLVPSALVNVFSDFLSDREVVGVRPATLDFYRREIRVFVRWAEAVGAKEIANITPDLLRSYFLSLRERRSRNGIHKNYTVVKTWLRWAWEEYELESKCPIARVKIAGPVEHQQPAIELESFTQLLSACRGRHRKRDQAILLFLLDTGIRRSELCRVEMSALRRNGVVWLKGEWTKNGDPGLCFLTRTTQKALRAYLAGRGELTVEDPLFASATGDAFTPSGLRQVIRRACERAGVPEQGMHRFRRAFALESKRAGADNEDIRRLLRQKRTESTRRYLPLTEDDLRYIHELTSPINRLRRRKK
jgi:site-specific recombinase XerD